MTYDKLKICSGNVESFVFLDKDTTISLWELDCDREEIESSSINLEDLENIILDSTSWKLQRETKELKILHDNNSKLSGENHTLRRTIKELEDTLKVMRGLK